MVRAFSEQQDESSASPLFAAREPGEGHCHVIRAEAEQAIARNIGGFYNPVRRHSALDYISPAQFERDALR